MTLHTTDSIIMEKTTRKAKKGDGAKVEIMWTLLIMDTRVPWINTFYMGHTRGGVKEKAMQAGLRFTKNNYGKTWTVRKVVVSLAD